MRSLILLIIILFSSNIFAQGTNIVTDGTFGSAGTVTPVGNNFTIPESLGQTNGNNLFHSFSNFNIGTGDNAIFTGANSIANVISRVTGGNLSTIDGALKCEIPDANFFLLNPAGVIFGANATIAISGAFHVSTADYLKFSNGDRVFVNPQTQSTFSVADPSAFGFLGNSSGSITQNGASIVSDAGKTITYTGGDVNIDGLNSVISSPGGKIGIGASASAGEFSVDPVNWDSANFTAYKDVNLKAGSQIRITGATAGQLYIRSGNFVIDGSGTDGTKTTGIVADNSGSDSKGIIDINLTGNMSIKNNSIISNIVSSSGNGANLSIKAKNFSLSSGSFVLASTSGNGNSGDINLDINSTLLIDSQYGFYINSTGLGNAGKFNVKANVLRMENGSLIYGDSSEGVGSYGISSNITLDLTDLYMLDGSRIMNNSLANGKSGTIIVTAQGNIVIDGYNTTDGLYGSGIYSGVDANSISAGDVTITVGDLTLSNYGQIFTYTKNGAKAGNIDISTENLNILSGGNLNSRSYSAGNSGDITVNASQSTDISGSVTIADETIASTIGNIADSSGNSGKITITAPLLTVQNKGEISGTAKGTGKGSDITLNTTNINIKSGGMIKSEVYGLGNGGNTTITNTETLLIQGDSSDSTKRTGISMSVASGASGNAGALNIASKNLEIKDFGLIEGSTQGSGKGSDITMNLTKADLSNGGNINNITQSDSTVAIGGKVDITATESIKIHGVGIDTSSATITGIYSRTQGVANAGTVKLNAPVISIEEGGAITASSFASGTGGMIDITATDSLTVKGSKTIGSNLSLSKIESQAKSSGSAGSIKITAGTLNIENQGEINASASSSGNGGSITVKANDINIIDSGALIAVAGGSGNGGSITIEDGKTITIKGAINNSPAGIFSSTSGAGNAGTLIVNSDSVTVGNGGKISSSSNGTGKGGLITFNVKNLLLEDGGKIAAEGLSTGDSGSITVNATDAVELKNSSEISTSSNNGEGGNINMTITRLLHLLSSKITTEIKLENAVGNGGSIIIDPIYIILQNGSRLDSSASFGDGGAIDLTADVFLQSSDSVLDPESKFGKSGVVEINAPQIDMSSGLVTLPSNFASAEGLLPKSCSEKTDTVQSSFTVKRKNGVPPDFRGIFSRP